MNILVGEGLLLKTGSSSGGCGIYKISFSSGFFYFGSSLLINWRIRTQIRCIKSGFKGINTCPALRKMRGFDGDITIELIEAGNRDETYVSLRRKEYRYIRENNENPFMLNIMRWAYRERELQ